jgi:glucose-1-phosphate cytidylyltransferase
VWARHQTGETVVTEVLQHAEPLQYAEPLHHAEPQWAAMPRGGGAPAVLLCGGAGQRMGELTTAVPKPMLTVGGRPLLWHIMRGLAAHDSSDFFLAVGHLGHVIKDYFLSFRQYATDFTVRLGRDPVVRALAELPEEGWSVTCVDTGERSGTGARLRDMARLMPRWPIILTYGDVLADVNIEELLRFHHAHGRLATVTAAPPPARFGNLTVTGDQRVRGFAEKSPEGERGLVNIGYFVLEREVVERYLPSDNEVMFEEEPVRALVADEQLMAYQHRGFWQPVDTPKELSAIRTQWERDAAPWKVWR